MKNCEIRKIVLAYKSTSGTLSLPASVAWKRRLNMKQLMDVDRTVEEAIRELQQEFMDDEHSVDIGDGRREIKDMYTAEFSKRFNELMEQDTPVNIHTVPAETVFSDDLKLTDAELDTLEFMIEG